MNKHEDSKDDNNLIKIIIPVIVGVVVIAGIVIAVIIHKRNKRNKINMAQDIKAISGVNNDVVYDNSQRGFKNLK